MIFGPDNLKTTAPEKNIIALNRMTFGAADVELDQARKGGLKGFIENQLNPTKGDDDRVDQKIASTMLHIKYDSKDDKYPAIDEDRPLGVWNSSMDKLWPLRDLSLIHI